MMAAKCPECGRNMKFLETRPANQSVVRCPQCGRALVYAGHENLTKGLMLAAFFITLFLVRMHDGAGAPYSLGGFAIATLIVLIGRSFERLELNTTPSPQPTEST